MIEQSIIDKVVKIATRSAMNGHPVEKITWLPSANAAGDSDGAFAIKYCEPFGATETPPWEK